MLEAIKNRHSVRLYEEKDVEDEKVREILEAIRVAPSGMNIQPWRFIVIKNQKTRQALTDISHNQKWMMTAPIHIVATADVGIRCKEHAYEVDEYSSEREVKQSITDTSIAVTHLMLEAVNQGLSTCWVGYFDNKDIRPLLHIPNDQIVIGILTLGYESGGHVYKSVNRKEINDFVRYEKWS